MHWFVLVPIAMLVNIQKISHHMEVSAAFHKDSVTRYNPDQPRSSRNTHIQKIKNQIDYEHIKKLIENYFNSLSTSKFEKNTVTQRLKKGRRMNDCTKSNSSRLLCPKPPSAFPQNTNLTSESIESNSGCEEGSHWDCIQGKCVSHTCVPGYMFNAQERKCMPTNALVNCQSNELYDYHLKKCIPKVKPDCNEQYTWNYEKDKCLPICKDNFTFNATTNQCYKESTYFGCANGSILDHYLKKCVTSPRVRIETVCPNNSYYDHLLLRCVSPPHFPQPKSPKCPENSTFRDDYQICILEPIIVPDLSPNCSSGSFYHLELQRCVTKANYTSKYEDRKCPEECVVNKEINKCICHVIKRNSSTVICPNGSKYSETERKCNIRPKIVNIEKSIKCPDYFVYNSTRRICESTYSPNVTCPYGGYFDRTLLTCLHVVEVIPETMPPKCADGFALSDKYNKCISLTPPKCPEDSIFDSRIGECVSDFIEKMFYKHSCPKHFQYNSKIKKCVAEFSLTFCPLETIFNNETFLCEAQPTSIPGLKTYKCPENFTLDANEITCFTSDYVLRTAMPECPKDYFYESNVDRCYSINNVYVDKTIPTCPLNFTYEPGVRLCVNNATQEHQKGYMKCPPNFNYHTIFKLCVTNDIKIEPIPTPTCNITDFKFEPKIGNCLSSYTVQQQPPSIQCPDNFKYNKDIGQCVGSFEKMNTTLHACRDNDVFDPKVGKCVRTPCTDGMFYSETVEKCLPMIVSVSACPLEYEFDEKRGMCVPQRQVSSQGGIVPCPVGFNYNSEINLCIYDSQSQHGSATSLNYGLDTPTSTTKSPTTTG